MMRIHFIIPKEHTDFFNDLSTHKLGDGYPYWRGGKFNWAAQTWLVLREYLEGTTIGLTPRQGCINFAHSMIWRRMGSSQGEFRVGVRADYPKVFDLNFEIVQNARQIANPTRQAYLPYWPVPGIIPRKRSRTGVHTIAYAGRLGCANLATELRFPRRRILSQFAVKVIPPHKWHDLSEIDLLLAIRSFDRRTYDNKPPSKLFSSWLAGVPLIAGWDSAFSDVGKPGKNYVRVGSESELQKEVQKLCDDSRYYNSFVEQCKLYQMQCTHEAIANVWLETFKSKIATAFEQWSEEGASTYGARLRQAADATRNLVSVIRGTF